MPGLPEGYRPRKHRLVESFYLLAVDGAELRIKVVEGLNGVIFGTPKYKWTFKTGDGLKRTELEGWISEEEYNRLLKQAKYGVYHKDWYEFPMNDGLTLEVNQVVRRSRVPL